MLIASSVAATGAFYSTQNQARLAGFEPRLWSNQYGALGMLAGGGAVAIWVLRKAYVLVKKRQFSDFEVTRSTLLFLRRHHILLGWATLMTGTAHGIYFLLRYPNRLFEVYTGLLTLVLLVVLAGMGIWLDYRLAAKQRSKRVRGSHIALAVGFLVTLLIHAGG